MQEMIIKTDKERLSSKSVFGHLSNIEEAIDIEHVKEVEQRQLDTFAFKSVNPLPVMVTMRDDVGHKTYGHDEWPPFTFDQMWNDYGAMLLNELKPVYESVRLKDDKVFSIRPNLSQLVLPSLFGAQGSFYLLDEDSMPSVHKPPTREELEKRVDGEIDFKEHWTIIKYLEIIDCWKDLLKNYPKLKTTLHFTLPDLQGPFNLYFILRGSDAYTDLYTDPVFVHKTMKRITEVLIDVTNYLSDYIGQKETGFYWNYTFPGKVRNVDDNSVLVSREHYLEFILPYNKLLFKSCGGGIHHYCGKGDHLIDLIMEMEGAYGINFGNPELQNWDSLYNKSLEHKKVLLWDKEIPVKTFKELDRGVIMRIFVSSIAEGKAKMAEYRE